ncbi:MAG: glycosyltransferase, partial [Campylobacterota bacterium]|nr:glycosyltransferase [Campylobacterota bacterium]
FVLGGLDFGGIEVSLLGMCKYLKRKGIFYPVVLNISGHGDMNKIFEEKGIELINLKNNNERTLSCHRLDTSLILRKMIKDIRPSIIHTMTFPADYHTRLAALGMKIPIITHIHNTKIENKWHRRFFNRLLSSKTTLYIAVSKKVKEVIEKWHTNKKPVYVLYNTIDTERYKIPSKQEIKEMKDELNINNEFVLGGVGRMFIKQKGFDILIRAFKKILDRDIKMKLVLVGSGKDEKLLKDLATSLNIEKQVIFTGYKEDAYKYMKMMDLFIMPSLYEGFGNVHLEAMYMEMPCIISKYVPSLEIAGNSAFKIEPSEGKIVDAVLYLMKNRKSREDMVKEGNRIIQSFTMEKYIEKLEKLYEDIGKRYYTHL